ncbi:MAG: tetratricopeptide repeat protein [Myxococcota bacterium]|nr:tetratricopeptide repeat protein [Myxococcota bacterium]
MIVALLACQGDPQMARLSEALTEYDRAQVAVERGDWPGAAAAFEAAAQKHPEAAALHAWHAEALSQAGDLSAARAVLDAVVPAFPGNLDLRYNRAAYAARAGALEAAAADLRYLYARDLLDPLVAGEDPDFAELTRDPQYADLAPAPQVRLQVRGEAGSILLGEPYTAELVIETKRDAPISVENIGAFPMLLQHTRTIEDLTIEESGWSRRIVSVEWSARASGEERIGPWLLSAHGSSAIAEPLPVTVVTLPGRAEAEPSASPPGVLLPSQLRGARALPLAERLEDGRIAVMHEPDDSPTTEATSAGSMEYRIGGQTRWSISLFSASGPTTFTLSGTRLTVE